MKDQAETSVPGYLQELLQPTPSGTAKLIAAWDGLTPETQMALLAALKRYRGSAYLDHRVIEKILTSENTFVRYLVARNTYLSDHDQHEKDLKAQIDNDPEPLVRYAHLETDILFSAEADPKKFFALPHEARLATVRRLAGSGEEIAELIAYAVKHQLKDGRVSETELYEILSDYLYKPEFKQRYFEDQVGYDGYARFRSDEDIKALWKLVLNVPEELSYVLIKYLPESDVFDIPRRVLNGMSKRQLRWLFYRSDIGLEKFRKKKFFEATNGNDKEDDEETEDVSRENLRDAAISNNFDITNQEFSEILSKPTKYRIRELEALANYAKDLRLCVYNAARDVLDTPIDPENNILTAGLGIFERDGTAERVLKRKMEQLEGWEREEQLLELKLYQLAVRAVPWKKDEKGYPPSDELTFLEKVIVEGDTWATFWAFSIKWDKVPDYKKKQLEKYLPKIWEAGEQEDFSINEEDVDETEQIADRVVNKMVELLSKAQDEPEGEESEFTRAFGKLSEHATVAQEETLEAVISMKAELAELRRAHNRQRLFSWIVIGLLVVLLFVGR